MCIVFLIFFFKFTALKKLFKPNQFTQSVLILTRAFSHLSSCCVQHNFLFHPGCCFIVQCPFFLFCVEYEPETTRSRAAADTAEGVGASEASRKPRSTAQVECYPGRSVTSEYADRALLETEGPCGTGPLGIQ